MSATYLTVSEVSDYLKLPEETVYKYARTGRMPASKVGRYWRFDRSRIDEWVSQNSNTSQLPLRVMVVDDDPVVRNLLAKWIMELGGDVNAVSGGDEAIRLLAAAEGDYDLLLLDLLMPSPNGVETLERVRRERPDLEVVLVTAYFDSSLMDEALQSGPLTILKKPVQKEALKALLASHGARVR
jgi:excisionase family DNA binding protein